MKKVKLLSFNKKDAEPVDLPSVKLVDKIEKRSEIKVIADLAGEGCLKTPKAVPNNKHNE